MREAAMGKHRIAAWLGKVRSWRGWLLGLWLFTGASWAVDRVHLVYVANMPDVLAPQPGLAELATWLAELRRQGEPVLFLHGGDSLGPSTLASFDKGAHMIDLLNMLEPDAMAIAKREFAYLEDELILRMQEASFPLLSANLLDMHADAPLRGSEQSLLLSKGGVRIGIVAVTSEEVKAEYLAPRTQVLEPLEVLRQQVAQLKQQGAELVVLMADFADDNLRQLARDLGVSVLLEARSQQLELSQEPDFIRVATGSMRTYGVYLQLCRGCSKQEWQVEAHLRYLGHLGASREFSQRVQDYQQRLDALLSVELGISLMPLDTRRSSVRSGETAFGNLVADAMRHHVQAELAFFNAGSIRGDRQYPAKTPISRGLLQRELPFANQVVLVELSGEQIWQALEHSVSRVDELKGRFLQLANMQVEWEPLAPQGQRIRAVTVAGKPLELAKNYRVATYDYLIAGGDDFAMLNAAKILTPSYERLQVWEVVAAYVQKQAEISPRLEGRWKVLK